MRLHGEAKEQKAEEMLDTRTLSRLFRHRHRTGSLMVRGYLLPGPRSADTDEPTTPLSMAAEY